MEKSALEQAMTRMKEASTALSGQNLKRVSTEEMLSSLKKFIDSLKETSKQNRRAKGSTPIGEVQGGLLYSDGTIKQPEEEPETTSPESISLYSPEEFKISPELGAPPAESLADRLLKPLKYRAEMAQEEQQMTEEPQTPFEIFMAEAGRIPSEIKAELDEFMTRPTEKAEESYIPEETISVKLGRPTYNSVFVKGLPEPRYQQPSEFVKGLTSEWENNFKI